MNTFQRRAYTETDEVVRRFMAVEAVNTDNLDSLLRTTSKHSHGDPTQLDTSASLPADREAVLATSTSHPPYPAVPLHILQQWINYAHCMRQMVIDDIDASSICSYLPPAPVEPHQQRQQNSAMRNDDIRTSASIALARSVASVQRAVCNNEAFTTLYARTVRWTLLLAFWIQSRLSYLLEHCSDGDGNACSPGDGENEYIEIQGEELRRYQTWFLPTARTFIGMGHYRCLSAITQTVFFRCQRQRRQREHQGDEMTKAQMTAPIAATTNLMNQVIGNNANINSNISSSNSSTRTTSDLAKGIPRCEMSMRFYTAVAAATSAVGKDTLQITWDHIDPKVISQVVMRRLQGSIAEQPLAPISQISTGPILYSAPMAPFLFLSRPSGDEGGRSLSPAADVLANTGDVLVLQRGLSYIAYIFITKVENDVVEHCYYTLPFVMHFVDFIVILRQLAMRLPPSERAHPCVLIDTSLPVVRAVQDMYRRHTAALLRNYKYVAGQSKNCIVISANDSMTWKISTPALSLLTEIVEPTLNVLRRYPSQAKDDYDRPSSIFKSTMLSFVKDTVIDFLYEAGQCTSSSSVRAQMVDDVRVVTRYIVQNSNGRYV